MKLTRATAQHLKEMMLWFPDEYRYKQWGGPQLRYPFTPQSFFEDCQFDKLDSYVLLNEQQHLIGFGQYYLRLERCHFGRLVISPDHRQQGHATTLITALAKVGIGSLKSNMCSLFVLPENAAAVKLYTSLGFTRTPYPDNDILIENIWYMTIASYYLQPK